MVYACQVWFVAVGAAGNEHMATTANNMPMSTAKAGQAGRTLVAIR